MLKRITKSPLGGDEIKFKKVSGFSYFLNFALICESILALIMAIVLIVIYF